ncbi:hypothetical protein PHMEG_00010381 [Phytophthora megakarya]|uniref:Reverse transcriptase RNase H-like domain-containing protein n=1 Tax=Phytophthora megakarya TaxID=4795 RepID=A0A225WFV6_9STRA|nr:hypothetical protein PHMEG_00010381 [Phytophthora megakarya]
MLATAVNLTFTDDEATACLFTDASDVGWSVIVTQVTNFDSKAPVTKQQHKPLMCMSDTFTGSQLNWTVIEKEPYLHSRGGKIIPRPWSEVIDCRLRNGVLHFDFYMWDLVMDQASNC